MDTVQCMIFETGDSRSRPTGLNFQNGRYHIGFSFASTSTNLTPCDVKQIEMVPTRKTKAKSRLSSWDFPTTDHLILFQGWYKQHWNHFHVPIFRHDFGDPWDNQQHDRRGMFPDCLPCRHEDDVNSHVVSQTKPRQRHSGHCPTPFLLGLHEGPAVGS